MTVGEPFYTTAIFTLGPVSTVLEIRCFPEPDQMWQIEKYMLLSKLKLVIQSVATVHVS
jgi:hypothetical protein